MRSETTTLPAPSQFHAARVTKLLPSLALLAIATAFAASVDGAPPKNVEGAAIYAARCAGCHQTNGTGLPGVFPPLAGSEWVIGNEAILIQVVLHGVAGPLTVRGTQYDMNMPALGAHMTDTDVAAVATYVRAQWGNEAAAVTPETVARQRAASAKRTTPWSEAELQKLQR